MAPLSMALKTWRNDCHTQIRSCGIILQLTELGEGMMKIESVSMGSIFHIQYANHGNYRATLAPNLIGHPYIVLE